ncbi:MAG TPA: MlaE family lipid ABC transporter permease subunit [Stellaceae bacterium]|nr:MlaE family lipid ABC transporter permease subunit [Stellaceae bacterium]
MASGTATLAAAEEGETLVFAAAGRWLVATAAELDRDLSALDLPRGRRVTLDLAGIDRLDTAGAWLVLRTENDLLARGNEVEIRNLHPGFAPLFAQVRAGGAVRPVPHPRPAHHTLAGFVARIGEVTIGLLARGYGILGFLGLVATTAGAVLRDPRRLRVKAILVQMERTGVDALPIVGLLSFLIGIVIAFQGADQLHRFGAEIYTVNLLGVGILRELAVLMTAIILAGRSGSAFTAQLGTMRVNEEIDALRAIGLDPIEVLVIPRLFALLLTLPMLALYADFAGLLGGWLMTWGALGITVPQFLHQLQSALGGWTFWIGIIKSPFFAVIIALVGCYEGLRVGRSAESVGRQTTLSVVEAIFLVIVSDAAFSILFSILQI